jgi:hypothetical protein
MNSHFPMSTAICSVRARDRAGCNLEQDITPQIWTPRLPGGDRFAAFSRYKRSLLGQFWGKKTRRKKAPAEKDRAQNDTPALTF